MTTRNTMHNHPTLLRGCLVTAAVILGLAGAAQGQAGAIPQAPTSPAAKTASSGLVRLTWADNSANETGFAIERTPAFSAGIMIVGPNLGEFTDDPGAGEFSYRISAFNEAGRSEATDPVAVRVKAGTTGLRDGRAGGKTGGGDGGGPSAPSVPSSVALSVEGTSVRLRWGDPGGNAEGFELQRQSFMGGAWSDGIGRMLAPSPTEFLDPGLAVGTYRYRLRAVNSADVSGFTNWMVGAVTAPSQQVQTTGLVLPPAAPSGVAASDIGNGRAMLSWADNSNTEQGFRIERNPAFAAGQVSVAANGTAYIDQCGPGTFSYRVASYNESGVSAFSAWAPVVVAAPMGGGGGGGGGSVPSGSVGQDGWTVFEASPDTRTIYVSASTGNDSNDGLSEQTPKRTIAAGYTQLRHGYPDWLLLKSGDTWYERIPSWQKSGRSATEPIRLGAYGAGERPKIFSGAGSGIDANAPVVEGQRGYVAFTDIHFKPHTYDGTGVGPYGITLLGYWTDVLIENCKFEGYFVNIAMQGFDGQDVRNMKVRRNVIVDAYQVGTSGHAQGLLIGHCTGALVEENVFDHNGWSEAVSGATPTIFRHNVYINPDNTNDVTTRGNIVARGGASGLRSCGNLSEFNLLLANPANLIAGPNARIIRYNTILDSRDILSSNPLGSGIVGRFSNCEIYGNVLAYRTASDSFNIYAFQLADGTSNTNIHNNVVYKWNGPTTTFGQAMYICGAMTNVQIRNNVFHQAGGGRVVWAEPPSPNAPVFSGNRYYSTNPSPFASSGSAPVYGATYAQWLQSTGELGSNWGQASFPASDRTIATYMQSLGRTPTLDAFLNEARQQSKSNWRQEFTARAAGDYFREGFGVVVQMP